MATETERCEETSDNVCIDTFYGVTAREPFQFLEEDDDGVEQNQDISGWDLVVVVTEGPPESPGTEVRSFTLANDGIERDDDEATFTLIVDDEAAEEIDPGRYSFRAELYVTGETVPFDIPFRGWFNHRRSGR